jgi:lysophospholipase L1-like esterase
VDQAATSLTTTLLHRARRMAIPAAFAALALVTIAFFPVRFRPAGYELVAFALIVALATTIGGTIRAAATLIASILFGFFTIEFVCAFVAANFPTTSKGFSVSQPLFGWGPSGPGTYHARRLAGDGTVIFDVDYTIDESRLRQTVSAPSSQPMAAFFGDSFTFGEGVRDEDTLPQAFAHVAPNLHVLNLGFSGYGPQQFLRAVETGFYDHLLTNPKVFVFQTSAWHAERSSCKVNFAIRAPRYVLLDGKPVFAGACASGAMLAFDETLGNLATFNVILQPLLAAIEPSDIDLYIAEVREAAKLAKAKYGVPTVVIYLPAGDAYLARARTNDAEIAARFRQAGLLVLDGSLAQSDFPPHTLLTIAGDGHPTAAAHRARAQHLYDFLKANLPNAIAANTASKPR